MSTENKLLGGLSFVSRTFEGSFEESPFVLDMDANLYFGPADHISRDEHSAIEVIYHFLRQTHRIDGGLRDLMRDQSVLLEAFATLDDVRQDETMEEFRIFIFGTYDGELLNAGHDDEMPAGPCGRSVNELKRRFYDICRRMDGQFGMRDLTERQRDAAIRFEDRPAKG
jgi:hypothetical protein